MGDGCRLQRHHSQLLRHGAGVEDDARQPSRGDSAVQDEELQEGVIGVVVRVRLAPAFAVACRRVRGMRVTRAEWYTASRAERTSGGRGGRGREGEVCISVFFSYLFVARKVSFTRTCTGCAPIWSPRRRDVRPRALSRRRWLTIAAAPPRGSSTSKLAPPRGGGSSVE